MDEKIKEKFEARLRAERNEFIKKRRSLNQTWQDLNASQIEFEEQATNEFLATALNQLDSLEKQQLDAIFRALGRLQSDVYDGCEMCGGTISEKRLEVMPWTTLCITCAENQENGRWGEAPAETEGQEADLPTELQGLSDVQLQNAVIDAVRRDGTLADRLIPEWGSGRNK